VLPLTLSSGSLPPSPFSPPPPASAAKTSYDSLIETIAAQFDIDAGLLHAVVQTESGYDSSAVSPKGAIGLMQVLPPTGRRFGFTDLKDPKANLSAGAAYLKWLLNRFDDNLELALAAYNAGESAVERYGSTVPPYRETRSYVASVISRYRAMPPGRASHDPAAPGLAPGTGANQYASARQPTPIPPLRLLEKLGSLLLSAPPS
jgi:soluble lytic murein transglycosylase-like protein